MLVNEASVIDVDFKSRTEIFLHLETKVFICLSVMDFNSWRFKFSIFVVSWLDKLSMQSSEMFVKAMLSSFISIRGK